MPAPAPLRLDRLALRAADSPAGAAFHARVPDMRAETVRLAEGAGRAAPRFGPRRINRRQAGRELDPAAARPTPGSADVRLTPGSADVRPTPGSADVRPTPGSADVRPMTRAGPLVSIRLGGPDGSLVGIAPEAAPDADFESNADSGPDPRPETDARDG